MRFTLSIEGDASELAALLASVPTELTTLKPLTVPIGNASPVATAEALVAVAEAAPAAEPTNGQPKATRTRTTKATNTTGAEVTVTAADMAATPAATATHEAPAAPATEAPAATAVTLDSLRKEMQTKLAHSDTIVGWLGELGAKNLSTLAPEQYEALHAKLQTLS